MKTHNGATTYYSTGNPLLEFFSKAGSLFEKRTSYYGNEAKALDLFLNAWAVNPETAMKLLLWCRDVRGGAGNRSGSRSILTWLANQEPAWVKSNLDLIPKYGRWDDLSALVGTSVEQDALRLWSNAILEGNQLAAKWAPRDNKSGKVLASKLRTALGLSAKNYRKLVVKNTNVVETQMCNNSWEGIEYSHVPSLAMSRYGKAFKKHDLNRFSQFLGDASDPTSTVSINAGVVYPHDLLRADKEVANAQFGAMPNYFKTDMRVMPVIDLSGSMGVKVSGSISALDIAIGLGLYASDRLGSTNPFYRKLIPFSNTAKFYAWSGKDFYSAAQDLRRGEVANTNLEAVFDLLLNTATFMNVTNAQMPNVLLIISDGQFDSMVDQGSNTVVEKCLNAWNSAGYDSPKIVYWNTAGYAGSPATAYSANRGLVSGFSPSILKAVFEGDDFSPMGIMYKTLENYTVTVP